MANYIKNKGNNAVNDSLGENEKQAVGAKYMMGDIKLAGYYIKGEGNKRSWSPGFGSKRVLLWVQHLHLEAMSLISLTTTQKLKMRTDNETDDIILAYRNNLSDRTTLYAKLCSSDRGANAVSWCLWWCSR